MKCFLLVCLLTLVSSACCNTVIETEKPKRGIPIPATCHYRTTTAEQPYYGKLDASETRTYYKPNASEEEAGSDEPKELYSIHGKKDKYVSWFGIVRGISKDGSSAHRYRLLVEQKYFDGLTDCGMILVSIDGGGDFLASAEGDQTQSIPLLSLVRIYGKVAEETEGLPRIEAEYVRVWPWLTFTFMDSGREEHGNPKWRGLCKLCDSEEWIYNPAPNRNYYLKVLGNPQDFKANAMENQSKR